MNGSGSDDCMVDLSEEVVGAETAAGGPGSVSEQSSQLTEAFLSAATKHGVEAETEKKQASAMEGHGM